MTCTMVLIGSTMTDKYSTVTVPHYGNTHYNNNTVTAAQVNTESALISCRSVTLHIRLVVFMNE